MARGILAGPRGQLAVGEHEAVLVELDAAVSHCVAGLAPMKQNRPEQSSVLDSPECVPRSATCSRRPAPDRPCTSTLVSSSIRGSASMRSIR